jgi:hypothetical protein
MSLLVARGFFCLPQSTVFVCTNPSLPLGRIPLTGSLLVRALPSYDTNLTSTGIRPASHLASFSY